MHGSIPAQGAYLLLHERYNPINLLNLMPAFSMAMGPVLTQLDILRDDDTLFQAIKADLSRSFPHAGYWTAVDAA
jgi:hypothetical protein